MYSSIDTKRSSLRPYGHAAKRPAAPHLDGVPKVIVLLNSFVLWEVSNGSFDVTPKVPSSE